MRALRPAIPALLLAALLAAPPGERYRFFRDDREVRPRILPAEGRPGEPAAGDVLALRGTWRWMTLEGPGEYRIHEEGSARVRLRRGGPDRVVWYRIGGTGDPPPARDLLGLRIRSADPESLALLAGIDPARTTLTVYARLLGDDSFLAAIPDDLERLVVRATGWRIGDGSPGTSVLARLARFRKLRVLVAPGLPVPDPSRLAAWEDLRVLVLSGASDLADLSFTAKLPRLHHLDVVGTSVSPIDAAALASARPDLDLLFDWRQPLRRATAGCDRIEAVVPFGVDPGLDGEARPLATIEGRVAVDAFLDRLELRPGPGGDCGCRATLELDFSRQGSYVATLGLVHGGGLRWSGWPSVAWLTPKSVRALALRLEEHGVGAPRSD